MSVSPTTLGPVNLKIDHRAVMRWKDADGINCTFLVVGKKKITYSPVSRDRIQLEKERSSTGVRNHDMWSSRTVIAKKKNPNPSTPYVPPIGSNN